MEENENLLKTLVSELEDHKADDVAVYQDVSFATAVIAVSCESARHGKVLAEYVVKYLKKIKHKYFIEGLSEANWIAIDLNDIIVHILRCDVREYYKVDELWAKRTAE